MPTSSPSLALIFTVAGTAFGLRSEDVREVLSMAALHRTPEMPPLLNGFLALRGTLVPVIQLERLTAPDQPLRAFSPEEELTRHLVVARTAVGTLAWGAESPRLIRYRAEELVGIPAGHTLNRCAEWSLSQAGQPPVALLDPARLLLEKEHALVESMAARMQRRLAELPSLP